MQTVKQQKSFELTIKKSKFSGFIYPVDDLSTIKKILAERTEEFSAAKHIVWAYRLINQEKYTDAHEPKGSAGAPLFKLLKQQDIVNCLLVVARYFGGIKLGIGGLIRAYTQVGQQLMSNNLIAYQEKIIKIKTVKLSAVDKFKSELKKTGAEILEIEFGESAKIKYSIDK